MPNSLTALGNGIEYSNSVFKNTAIEELVIPASVTQYASSQNDLFGNMPQLRRIEFKGRFININNAYGIHFTEDTKLEEIILPEGQYITVWANNMFRNCNKLDFTDILHPEQVIRWDNNAFYGVTAPNPSKGIPAVFNMPNLHYLHHYPWGTATKQVTLLLPQDFMVETTYAQKQKFKAIYVNDDLYETYLADQYWRSSSSILHRISEYVEE